jgi:uncharacterized membrane protein YccC
LPPHTDALGLAVNGAKQINGEGEIQLNTSRNRAWVESVSPVVEHSARTAVAAVASLLIARLCQFPEAYWAPLTTLVITQSSLGAALTVSSERLAGTALGAVVAAIVASLFGPSALVFGASTFILGLLCAITRSDRNAYRFAGVTLTAVLLIPRPDPTWLIAIHRFAEVSVGIAVALILSVVWPERESTSPGTS